MHAIVFLTYVVLATIFGPPSEDRTNRGGFPCVGPMHQRLRPWTPEARDLFDRGLIVAATKLPCWTVIEVCVERTGICSRATVADVLPQKKWRSPHDLDLWKTLARVLGHNGMERVKWWVVKKRKLNT